MSSGAVVIHSLILGCLLTLLVTSMRRRGLSRMAVARELLELAVCVALVCALVFGIEAL